MQIVRLKPLNKDMNKLQSRHLNYEKHPPSVVGNVMQRPHVQIFAAVSLLYNHSSHANWQAEPAQPKQQQIKS